MGPGRCVIDQDAAGIPGCDIVIEVCADGIFDRDPDKIPLGPVPTDHDIA